MRLRGEVTRSFPKTIHLFPTKKEKIGGGKKLPNIKIFENNYLWNEGFRMTMHKSNQVERAVSFKQKESLDLGKQRLTGKLPSSRERGR